MHAERQVVASSPPANHGPSRDMRNHHPGPYAPPSVDPEAADRRPGPFRDLAFWGMTSTQFLGAFNDNLFKQILLLMFVAVPIGDSLRDLQWAGTFTFSLPFILFSGFAGFLSDRYPKRRVIVASKVAEVAVMSLGMVLFLVYAGVGLTIWVFALLTGALFLMGAQSAFFGPGKYGILPELFHDRHLPSVNGIILMTTFLAIIFGAALAGVLSDLFPDRLWVAGCVCIVIAVSGVLTSLMVRRVPPAQSSLRFDWSALTIPKDIRRLLREDRAMRAAIVVSTIFWLTAALVQMSVNSLGKLQLNLSDTKTSLMVSMISVGIAAGSLLAGALSHDRFNTRLMKCGAWGLVFGLVLMALPGWNRPHLLGYAGSLVTLVVLGGFTGLFAVPLQVFLQARPPADRKGRTIATQNLLNWVGITLSAGVYFAADALLEATDLPRSTMFAVAAVLMLTVCLYYHPKDVELG